MSKEVINTDLIDAYRKNVSTIWINDLGNEKTEIVPKQFEHWYLLNSNNIDESIYRYYHFPTKKMLTQSEFEEKKNSGFAGKKETAIKPYTVVFCGAYHLLPNFLNKLSGIANLEDKSKPKIKGKIVKTLCDLKPYFEDYAAGFKKGFEDFETDEIKPFLTLISDKQDYVFKVFDYVTKSIIFTHSWANLSTGFTKDGLNGYEIKDAFEDGKKEGYFYKAWSIILSNNNLFSPLFREYFVNHNLTLKEDEQPVTFENLKRLCEISLEYSKGKNWSIKDIPIEFDAITKIDLFIENLTKVGQQLVDEGKKPDEVCFIIDAIKKQKESDLANPLLKDNKTVNEYFISKLDGLKHLFSSSKIFTQSRLSYKRFANILDKMFDENFDFKPNLNYEKLTIEVIAEIKEKLFELGTKEQRDGFLKNVFRSFFDNGKDYHLYQIHTLEKAFKQLPNNEKKYSDAEFDFLYNCLLCLREIVVEVSEEALNYDIDFEDVMLWSWRHSENKKQNPFEVFVYYVSGSYVKSNSKATRTDNKTKLTINQIALMYVYEGLQITRENGNEIAKSNGHNSGEKLFQRFTFYSSLANRKGNESTKKKLLNKIELIESIIELLPTDKQEWAKDEVSILKKIYEAEYK